LENNYTIEDMNKLCQSLPMDVDGITRCLKGDLEVRLLGGSPPEQLRHFLVNEYYLVSKTIYDVSYENLPLYINTSEPRVR